MSWDARIRWTGAGLVGLGLLLAATGLVLLVVASGSLPSQVLVAGIGLALLGSMLLLLAPDTLPPSERDP